MDIRIGITGRRRRGKGALAQAVRARFPQVQEHNFADALKVDGAVVLNRAIAQFDIPRAQLPLTPEGLNTEAHRALLVKFWQWYGTEFCREADPDYWVRRFHEENGEHRNVVVTDCRFPNEAAYLIREGYLMVKVTGPCREEDGRDPNHPSEQYIDDLPVELVYANTGSLADMATWVERVLVPVLAGGRK